MKKLVIYVPVIHAGYIKLFEKYADSVSNVLLLGEELVEQLSDSVKEIRQLDPVIAARLICSLNIFRNATISVLRSSNDRNLAGASVVTMDDTICRRFAEQYLQRQSVEYDTTFLRWHPGNVSTATTIQYDRTVELAEVETLARLAITEGDRSTSWWRQVGIVAWHNGKILGAAHNAHLPDEHTVFMEGDPRDSLKPGTFVELCSSAHAERVLCARLGRPILDGASALVKYFPCVPCVQDMAIAGFKHLYYMYGNAYLNVDQTAKAMGMEIIYVRQPEH